MVAEELLRDVLDNKKIEVKWDFMAPETGNVYIEYQYWVSHLASRRRRPTITAYGLERLCT